MNNFNLISTNVIVLLINVSSSKSSGLLCSAISCEVSLLTVFPRGRSEAFVVVVWNVTLHLLAVVTNFCAVVSILLRVLF
jgi:hypothetical protein